MEIIVSNRLDGMITIDRLNQRIYSGKHALEEEIKINLSDTEFTYPIGMIALLLGINNIAKSKKVIIDFESVPRTFLSYIERLNFFEFIPTYILNGYDLNYLKNRTRNDTSDVLLEIMQLKTTDDVMKLTESIYSIFLSKGVSGKVINNINNIATELATNIIDHSEGNGYVAIQYYKTTNTIRLAIADDGVGIINKYRIRVPHLTNQLDILKSAFQDRSSTRESLGGKGLNNMRLHSFADNFEYTSVHLKTGNNIYDIQSRDITVIKTTSNYPGTYYDFCIKIA